MDIFWSAVGSAVGGFIGVMLYYYLRFYVEKRSVQPRHVKTYLCGNNRNLGQSGESEGEIMHHHGKQLALPEQLKQLGADHPVWEWTKDPVGKGAGGSIFYGPYTTDFAKPGTYTATFRLKATGLASPADITDDVILLRLDVNRTLPKHLPTVGTAPLVAVIGAQYQAAIKYVRASELAQRHWVDFQLPFYSDAQGVWEYRAIAYDGSGDNPDNIGRFGMDTRIFFDTVAVHEVREMKAVNV